LTERGAPSHVVEFDIQSADIESWLVAYAASLLDLDPQEIDPQDSFASYGLDSSGALGLIGDLGQWLGRTLDPALLYSHPTMEALSRHLAGEGGQ
jgi:acyl carrier protein